MLLSWSGHIEGQVAHRFGFRTVQASGAATCKLCRHHRHFCEGYLPRKRAWAGHGQVSEKPRLRSWKVGKRTGGRRTGDAGAFLQQSRAGQRKRRRGCRRRLEIVRAVSRRYWLPQNVCGLRRVFRRSSSAVATSREGHRSPRSGRDLANAITVLKQKRADRGRTARL